MAKGIDRFTGIAGITNDDDDDESFNSCLRLRVSHFELYLLNLTLMMNKVEQIDKI